MYHVNRLQVRQLAHLRAIIRMGDAVAGQGAFPTYFASSGHETSPLRATKGVYLTCPRVEINIFRNVRGRLQQFFQFHSFPNGLYGLFGRVRCSFNSKPRNGFGTAEYEVSKCRLGSDDCHAKGNLAFGD